MTQTFVTWLKITVRYGTVMYKNYKLKNVFLTDVDYLPMDEFIEQIKTDDDYAEMYGELGPVYGKQWKTDKYDHELTDKEGFPNVKSNVDQIRN